MEKSRETYLSSQSLNQTQYKNKGSLEIFPQDSKMTTLNITSSLMFYGFFVFFYYLYSCLQQLPQLPSAEITGMCFHTQKRHTKTFLIQVFTSAWPKKQSRVPPKYNNPLKVDIGSSYSQSLSMHQKLNMYHGTI